METEHIIPNSTDLIDTFESDDVNFNDATLHDLTYEGFFNMKQVDNYILETQKRIHRLSTRILKIEAARPKLELYCKDQFEKLKNEFGDDFNPIFH